MAAEVAAALFDAVPAPPGFQSAGGLCSGGYAIVNLSSNTKGKAANATFVSAVWVHFALALVRTTLDPFLPLFPHAVRTCVLNTVLDAALARPRLVATFTRCGAVGALLRHT